MDLNKLQQTEDIFQKLPSFFQEHCRRTGKLAGGFLEYLMKEQAVSGMSDPGVILPSDMELMGKYHDIGKTAISHSVWLSRRPLTAAEQRLVHTHPLFGAYLIRGMAVPPEAESRENGFWEEAARCCQYHHERWDGAGYPFGISGESIPLVARIICIADAYDAMTSVRPYRAGMPEEEALEEIFRNKGKQFDPVLAPLFCELMQATQVAAVQ